MEKTTIQPPDISLTSVAAAMRNTPVVLGALLTAVSDDILSWKPTPDDWCIKEIIGHLIVCDTLAFGDRIEAIVHKPRPTIAGVDVDAIARERDDAEQPLALLLSQLTELREKYAPIVEQLTLDELYRVGHYPKHGDFRAADFVYEWMYHDHSHLMQILALLRQSAWPNFSETMQRALSQ